MTTNPMYEPPPSGSTNPSAANLSTGQLVAIVTLDRIKALEAERDALRAALDAEREAVRVLGELAYRQANRERLLNMDPTSTHPEVAGDQVSNGVALIRAMADVANNPIAAAAVKGTPNGEA